MLWNLLKTTQILAESRFWSLLQCTGRETAKSLIYLTNVNEIRVKAQSWDCITRPATCEIDYYKAVPYKKKKPESHIGIWIFEEIWGLSANLGFLKLSLHVINVFRHYLPLIFLVAFNSLFQDISKVSLYFRISSAHAILTAHRLVWLIALPTIPI